MKLILKFMKNHDLAWSKDAEKQVEDRGRINACTFQGICRRQGDWEGHRKLGNINFNQEILRRFSSRLSTSFNEFDDKIEGIEKDFALDVRDIFLGIKLKIKSSPDSQGQDLEVFFEFTTNVAGSVTTAMAEKFESLKDSIAHIPHAATLDSEHSYSRKAMEETYEECVLSSATSLPPVALANSTTRVGRKRRKKATVHRNRLTLVQNKLTGRCNNESIFRSVAGSAASDISEKLRTWNRECIIIVKEAYNKILKDFDVRYKDANMKQEGNPEAIAKLQQAVIRARAIMDGPRQRYLPESELYKREGAKAQLRRKFATT